MISELEKYVGIYDAEKGYAGYGHTNHGAAALPLLRLLPFASCLDVGCGHNEFVQTVRGQWPKARVVGADFACPSADVKADATALPFPDQSFDVLTAFDTLEHLLPAQVPVALAEFSRVSKYFIFSISYVPSVYKWAGQTLHPTVQPEAWWLARIAYAGGEEVKKEGRYITGHWKGTDTLIRPGPVGAGKSCILVGNGPSVLSGRRGFAIDSFDEVLRFNTFKTVGFEEHSGVKTTLWSTFGRGQAPQDHVKPQRVIALHEKAKLEYEPAEVWRIPSVFFSALRARVQEGGTTGDRKLLLPSSGFTVASWLLSLGVPKLTLVGFDHFKKDKSSLHHYWIPRAFSRPKEHDGDYEAAVMADLVAAGQIAYL